MGGINQTVAGSRELSWLKTRRLLEPCLCVWHKPTQHRPPPPPHTHTALYKHNPPRQTAAIILRCAIQFFQLAPDPTTRPTARQPPSAHCYRSLPESREKYPPPPPLHRNVATTRISAADRSRRSFLLGWMFSGGICPLSTEERTGRPPICARLAVFSRSKDTSLTEEVASPSLQLVPV